MLNSICCANKNDTSLKYEFPVTIPQSASFVVCTIRSAFPFDEGCLGAVNTW